MSLRKKIFGMLGALLTLSLGAAGWFVGGLVLSHASLLERQDALRRAQSQEIILQRERETLQSIATDWGSRRALQEDAPPEAGTPSSLENGRFQDSLLQNARIDLVLALRRGEGAYFIKTSRRAAGQGAELASDVISRISRLPGGVPPRWSGVLPSSQGPMLMAAAPIVSPEGGGSPQGTLILGRFFRAEEARSLSQSLGLEVAFWPLPSEDPALAPVISALSSDRNTLAFPPGGHTIHAFMVVRDLFHHPALLLRITVPRTLYQKALHDLRYFVVAVVVGGALLLLAILGIVDLLVVRRLSALERHLAGIANLDHLDTRIPHQGNDELAQVTQEANRMLEALAEAHRREQAIHQRFQNLVANVPGVVYRSRLDEYWTKVYVSDQFTALTGYPVEDFVDNRRFHMAQIAHPGDSLRVVPEVEECLARGRPYDVRFRIRAADGSWLWINDRGQQFRDSEDGSLWIDGIFTDITDLMASLERIQDSETLHRMVFETSGTALAVWEGRGPLLRVNEEFCRLTGLERSQVEGRRTWESFFDADPFLPGGAPRPQQPPRRYEGRLVDLQGVSHDVAVTVAPFPDGVRHVASLLDVTEARRTRRALEESERRYREMADALPQTLFETDPSGHLIFTNRAGFEAFGFDEDDLRRGLSVFEVIAPEDLPRARENFGKNLGEQDVIPREYLARRKSGETFPVMVYSQAIRHEGVVEGIRGLVVDITDLKGMEEQLRFLSMHDPLTGLYNRAFFDEEGARMASGRFDPLGVVVADLDGLKLVNDLLGHSAGDRLLRDTGRLLKEAFRSSDVVARVGGDEFAAFLPECGEGFAQEARRRILAAVEHHNETQGGVPLSLSVGCASGPGKSPGLTSLMEEADNLMYQQKRLQSPRSRARLLQRLLESFEQKTPDTSREEALIRTLLSQKSFPGADPLCGALLARYHDLGYVGLPGEIWRSADLLSEDEWRDMRRHPEIGYRIALACDHLAPVAEAILGHHERHDGTGYPRGLKGEEILPINRLFAVVDAYNAMLSPRPGRPARSSLEAAEELRRHAGSQFDPEAVAFFLEAFPELEDA